MQLPWTRAQLNELLPRIRAEIEDIEAHERPAHEPQPLPALDVDECLDYFERLMDIAGTRALTQQERFIHGQILSQYRGAVILKHLKKPGRFYLIPEETINEMMARTSEAKP